jgi:hypothetical protein
MAKASNSAGEPRLLLRTGDADLANAMGRARQGRDPRMDEGAVLASVQIPPDPLAVIMNRGPRAALRTDLEGILRQCHPDVNLVFREAQLHLLDTPGWARECVERSASDGTSRVGRCTGKEPSWTPRNPEEHDSLTRQFDVVDACATRSAHACVQS